MTTPSNTPTPIETYKQGTAGSISGFDSVSIVNDPTLGETDSSASAITNDIQSLVSQGIPSHLHQCISLIQSHISNYDNPHKDTFTSISLQSDSLGNTAEIFNRIIDGTVPLAPPICGWTAELDVGTPFLGLTCNRNSDLAIINAQGMIETLEANTLRADYTFGNPTYPCWTDVTQYLSPPTMMNPLFTTQGVQSSSLTMPSLPMIDSSLVTYVDNGQASVKQVIYTNPNQGMSIGADYTFSILVYPFKTSGSIYLRFNDYVFYADINNPSWQYLLNLSSAKESTTPLGSVTVLSNGWWRICITVSTTESNITALVGYDQNSYQSAENVQSAIQNNQQGYQGISGTPVFALCYPQLTNVAGVAPIITNASTLAPTTLTYAGSPSAVALNSFMAKAKFIVYTSLVSNGVFNIINYDNAFQITHNQTQTTYTLQGHETPNVFNEDILNGGLTIGCVSYSPEKVGWLTSNMEDTTTVSDFVGNASSALPIINTLTMGPFRGYISAASHYAVSDDCNALALLAQV